MKDMVINNLQVKGFEFLKNNAVAVVLYKPGDFKDETETYFDYLIGCEINRPHYYGKTIQITGNNEHCIATIYQHDDQNDTIVKKIHFKDFESDENIRKKFKRLLNTYSIKK